MAMKKKQTDAIRALMNTYHDVPEEEKKAVLNACSGKPTGTTDDPSLLVSIAEAGRLLGGLSRATIYRRIGDGTLNAVKMGGRTLLRRSDLEDFVADLSEAA